MLLIISNKSDLTSDYLILKLKELNIPFFRLNTEDYLFKYIINIHFKNNNIFTEIDYFNGNKIRLNDIQGVYFRQPIAPNLELSVSEEDKDFAERESLEVLRSLWLNHPKYLLLANEPFAKLQAV